MTLIFIDGAGRRARPQAELGRSWNAERAVRSPSNHSTVVGLKARRVIIFQLNNDHSVKLV